MMKSDVTTFNETKGDDYVQNTIIYPSSWYYNACVQGFLEVLAWGLGENGSRFIEEQVLQNDGRAVIPSDLLQAIFSTSDTPMPVGYYEQPVPKELKTMKRFVWWWLSAGYKAGFMKKDDRDRILKDVGIVETVCRSLFHKAAPYPNLAQLTWDTDTKVAFLNTWFSPDFCKDETGVNCSFCGQKYTPATGVRVYDAFFTKSLSTILGSGPDVFPNRFWNGNPNLTICKSCRSYFLCFHFVQHNRFFVNSDSFLVNWHLNRMLAGKLRQNRFAYQRALLDSLQFDPQLRKGISSWGLQNLEVLVLEWNKISYYPLPPNVARMLLVPQISSNIGKLSNLGLWGVVLEERFEYLPTMIYKSLRAYFTKDTLTKDPDVICDLSNIQPTVDLITLCSEIIRFLSEKGGRKSMNYINVGLLRRLGATAPLAQDDNLVFRLLELTRLNRKSDVYHLLLRVYIARNMEFPDALAQVFVAANSELFKTGVYAYISGLKPGDKPEAVTI